jgi:hypothetical protein
MTSNGILTWFSAFRQAELPFARDLHILAEQQSALPRFVRQDALAMRYLHLLGPLAWPQFPERDLRVHCGRAPIPYAPFAAACLVKVDQGLGSMGDLRRFLVEHPSLLWLLGFPLVADASAPWGYNPQASLPTERHFTRMLRSMPNAVLQFLLNSAVEQLRAELAPLGLSFGQCISMDTKHILAWVRENNPKAYLSDRYDKAKQPQGDPDCRLGCKRRHNKAIGKRPSSDDPPPTPTKNPIPGAAIDVGEFYWGYASGVVATKVPDWGEFVLAELTQPFDRPDVSYFFPLMAAAERRLGFRPPFAAFDAAFDAFYVYEYFHQPDGEGFAAVAFSGRGAKYERAFSPEGLPLCQAGLAMPLLYTFTDRSHLVEHEKGRYGCPLRHPQRNGESCPVQHKHWAKQGCIATMPTSVGARLRYQIDRHSETYQEVYKQRTASERINAQAVELGIERPHIRNGAAIANLNTLIYVLINLRALQRLRQRKREPSCLAQAA